MGFPWCFKRFASADSLAHCCFWWCVLVVRVVCRHPGGKSVIARNLGRDCTREFKDAHSHVRIDTAKHIKVSGSAVR